MHQNLLRTPSLPLYKGREEKFKEESHPRISKSTRQALPNFQQHKVL